MKKDFSVTLGKNRNSHRGEVGIAIQGKKDEMNVGEKITATSLLAPWGDR